MTTARLEYAELASFLNPACLIAHGASGPLYKGRLGDNQIVAIKLINSDGGYKQFLVQAIMLSMLRHENLVKLAGYCVQEDLRMLVFEFMPLGSLADLLHAHPSEPLDWSTRMKIAVGTAKGLEYLHYHASPPVIHRDLKPSSILLSEGFQPKLSSLGSAKLGPMGNRTVVRTRVIGMNDYMAPEYAQRGELSLKSDVYSFGVILLELITGRRVMDSSRDAEECNLIAWARPYMRNAELFTQLVDPKLHGQFPMVGLSEAIVIMARCLEEDASLRPSIADIVPSLDLLASQA